MIIIGIIQYLSDIILYLVYGFLFYKTFTFVSMRRDQNFENLLLSSVVIGFIIFHIMNLIPFSISYTFDVLGISVISVCLGLIFGKIVISNLFSRILYNIFHIRQSPDLYIWDTIVNTNHTTMIEVVTNDDMHVKGFPDMVEGFTDNPHITLANYTIYDKDGNIIEKSNVNTTILFDLSKVKYYKFHYHKDSDKMPDLKELCDNKYDDFE